MADHNQKIKEILDKALSANLSDAERGQVYANFARLYLESVNKINREYEIILDSAIGILNDLNEKEKELAAKLSK